MHRVVRAACLHFLCCPRVGPLAALTKSLASALSRDVAFAALLLQYYMQTLTLTLTPTLTLTLTPTLTINGAFFLD